MPEQLREALAGDQTGVGEAQHILETLGAARLRRADLDRRAHMFFTSSGMS